MLFSLFDSGCPIRGKQETSVKIEYSYTKFKGALNDNAHSDTYLASFNYNF